MNRINKWLSLLVTITALGGAAISAHAIEADTVLPPNPGKYSYISVDLISFDGLTLKTEAGDFLIDSSVKVTDHRVPDETGKLPEKAHVELTMDSGTLREVAIF
jgi:hypothetical protein